MRQLPSFNDSTHPNYVCLLKKSIYSLKQSSRQQSSIFMNFLQQLDFQPSDANPSFFHYHRNSSNAYILLYVDDIIITNNNDTFIQTSVQSLRDKFQLQNLGELHYFLGIQVQPTKLGLFLSQSQYTSNLLSRARMIHYKPVSTLLVIKHWTADIGDSLVMHPHIYRSIVGSLQYLTTTKQNISFTVNLLCQHMHLPRTCHNILLKCLLRYIKGTVFHGIFIYQGPLVLTAYCDVDWASDLVNHRSTTGFFLFLRPTLINWKVSKQKTVSHSSTELEYRALATIASDVIQFCRLLEDFGIMSTLPIPIYCDKKSTLALAHNPILYARTKHVEIDFHLIRDQIKKNIISLHHITSQDQPADIFTKSLPVYSFLSLCNKLTVTSSLIYLRGADKPS